MSLKTAKNPFHFSTQVNLIELTGKKARNLKELVDYLKQAPGSVIYHHTHHFLKQHQFLSPEPPNDFAYWVSNILQEERLGERLAAIDIVRFASVTALGEKILETIEQYLVKKPALREAPDGEEFHFMKSIGFIVPTPCVAFNLAEFADCVKQVTVQSLYHHIFEARIRLGRETNDFSLWLETELGETALAQKLSRLDPYTHTLEALRQRIINLVERRIPVLEGVA